MRKKNDEDNNLNTRNDRSKSMSLKNAEERMNSLRI